MGSRTAHINTITDLRRELNGLTTQLNDLHLQIVQLRFERLAPAMYRARQEGVTLTTISKISGLPPATVTQLIEDYIKDNDRILAARTAAQRRRNERASRPKSSTVPSNQLRAPRKAK